MSMTSASEPAIMATSVAVLDNNTTVHDKNKKEEKQRSKINHLRSPSVTSDNSSLLWQPHSLTNHKKSRDQRHRKHHRHRHHSDHSDHEEEQSATLLKKSRLPRELCSFEREYEEQRAKEISLHRRHSERHNHSKRHAKKNKYDTHNIELCNDYTKYEYHRKSRKDKNQKRHHRRSRERYQEQTGFFKVIQRIKEFFMGKKEEKKDNRLEYSSRNSPDFSRGKKHDHVSGKLFRSASDSDIEAVKHHTRHRQHHKHSSSKDDNMYKHKRHWKAKHGVNKLSSIYESSDKTGGERGSGSERLLLHSKTTASHHDYSIASYDEKQRSKEVGTSDGSYSHHSLPEYSTPRRSRHVRRSKDYRRLKKKWAKEHQSFENDLEKLERLVELMNKKKNPTRMEQKAIEDSSFLERLEAKQEKCVAEVDFTRHVLVCKLQRLENKLEESIQDTNNNSHEERENDLEDIREEMSKECRDLRKLLQETSDQLKQVLEEKRQLSTSNNPINNEEKTMKQGDMKNKKTTRNKDATCLSNDVPFPELSHHPLNLSHNRLDETDNNSAKINSPTRVTTYV